MSTKSATGHTPGPWEYGGPLGFGHWIVAQGGSPQIAVSYGGSTNACGLANAHLIAAAPQLLDLTRSVIVYRIDGDDRVWLNMRGYGLSIPVAGDSEQAAALLRFDAEQRAIIEKVEGKI